MKWFKVGRTFETLKKEAETAAILADELGAATILGFSQSSSERPKERQPSPIIWPKIRKFCTEGASSWIFRECERDVRGQPKLWMLAFVIYEDERESYGRNAAMIAD